MLKAQPFATKQFLDSNGAPLVGGLVYTYASGATSTPQTTYSNTTGTANTNPVVLNSLGEGVFYLDNALSYYFVVRNSAGVLQYTEDYIGDESSNVQILTNIATLRAIAPRNGGAIDIKYHTSASAGGGGRFRGVTGAAAGTYTHNNGTTIVPSGGDGSAAWLRIFDNVWVDYFGAIGDNSTDDTTAILAAKTYVGTNGLGALYFRAKTYKLTAGIPDSGKTIKFIGMGMNEDGAIFGNVTRLNFVGAISGIYLTGNGSGVYDMVLNGDNGAYNTALSGIVMYAKVKIERVYVTTFRGHGIHQDHYTDQSYCADILVMANKGNGILISDTAGGAVDANTTTWVNVDARINEGSGIYISQSQFSNTFINVTSQGNLNYGMFFAGTYGHVFGYYSEGNPSGGIAFASTATNNHVYGTQISDGVTDLSTAQKNWVHGHGESGGYNDYIAPTLLNSWVNFGGSRFNAGYCKDGENWVNLRGTVKKTAPAAVEAIFKLPDGFRPTARCQFSVKCGTGSTTGLVGFVFVDSDGNVYYNGGTSTDEFALDNIRFRAS